MRTIDPIADWLAFFAKNHGDSLAAVDIHTGRKFTYSAFNDRATRLASGLRSKYAIDKGDRVAMLAHNSTDHFELMFACWKIGAVFISDAMPGLIIYDLEFSTLIENCDIASLGRGDDLTSSPYEQLIATNKPDIKMGQYTLDDTNTLLYTSGTTGEPKGVIGTYRMTQTSILQQASLVNGKTVCLTYAPLFHTAGLNSFATPLFHFGGTLYVMRRWDADVAMEYLNNPIFGITHTLGVPYHLGVLSRHPDFAEAKFSTLQIIGVGGAPANQQLIDLWYEKGIPLSQSYGMTEIFGLIFQPPEEAKKNPNAAGKALMYTEVQIGDEQGKALTTGEIGEVQVKSPGLTPGYWNKPELTASSFTDGWFKTGDAAYMEADGTVYIVDRLKDMYISGGENVYPIEIENVVSKIPEVAMVAVIAVPDEKWQEVGKACIMLKQGCELTEKKVLDICNEKLAAYKIPKSVEFVAALPISAQGKILKRELRKTFSK